MGTKSITEQDIKNDIVDDLPEQIIDPKLAALKAKSKAKQEEVQMIPKITVKKEKGLNFGVVGSGQGGCSLCQFLYKLGYPAVALNTAMQDLKYIDIPDSNKLLLNYGVGGCARDITLGNEAAQLNRKEITQLINDKLSDSQINILCFSLGGGTGAGSCDVLIDVLSETGKPLIVMSILPMDTEDTQIKSNSLETLSKLSKYIQAKKVNNLIIVDNAKIETILQDVNQMDFYNVANKAIVEPLDVFNTLCMLPSPVKGIDTLELSKLLIDGEGISIYGELIVENYQEDTAIAEAIINNLSGNLLAGGFDLKQSKYVGVMIVANKEVWKQIPTSSVNYAMAMINDTCQAPIGIFKGIYSVEIPENVVKVYSIFSGLGLPDSRITELKKEVQASNQVVKNKDQNRNMSLNLDTGTNETVSAAQKIKDKIAQKSSTFGKFIGNSIIDRRK